MGRRFGFQTRSGDSIVLARMRDNIRGRAGQRIAYMTRRSPEVIGGMELMTPTSVSVTGTGSSASIGANGSVTFSSAATLSLNGVFNTDYDNYMISLRHVGSAANTLLYRLRASGSDASGSDYTRQFLSADSVTVSAARSSSQTSARILNISTTLRQGDVVNVYGPFLAQPTAMRNVSAGSASNAEILDFANTHSLSTSYDGFTLITGSGDVSGLVSVYGLVGT